MKIELDNLAGQLRDLQERFIFQGGSEFGCSLADEIERLRVALKSANRNHKHFEREWYMRGDEILRLRGILADVVRESNRLRDLIEDIAAARRASLEEAANACDDVNHEYSDSWAKAAICAKRIRALIEKESGNGS